MRVLLVEDNPGDARLVGEMLRDVDAAAVELSHADSLGAAREQLESGRFDAVLLDLGLPDASGLDGVAPLVERTPRMAVVVLTGREDEGLALEALRTGAQDYLVKSRLDGVLLLKTLRFAVERVQHQVADQFLAEAGRLLAASIDYEETLERVEQLAVESLADFCVIDLVEGDQVIRRLQVAHADPARAEVARRLTTLSPDHSHLNLFPTPWELQKALLVPRIDPDPLPSAARDEEQLSLLRELQPRSCIAVPLIAREQLLGSLVLLSCSRSYAAHDLALAERLAQTAALQMDSARLFRKAQDAVRARDRVLGIVAHDLRNPLGTISISTELLLDTPLSPEQRLHQLQIVRRSADRMNRLIQDLLDVTRIESGRLFLQQEHQDAGALVRETVELNSALAAAKLIQLSAEVERDPTPVMADHDRVVRVLENLVGNAIKFTPKGGQVTVRAGRRGADSNVCFSVADTGPGIAPENLSNLFLPFWQAHRGSSAGAGLGLAIARGIVEAHGGEIWAESTPGIGTTMFFTLPAAHERRQGPALMSAEPLSTESGAFPLKAAGAPGRTPSG